MRRTLGFVLLLCPVVLLGRVAQQPARIQGTITDLVNGQPLPNAAITFSGSGLPIGGFTDGAGRFAFDNVPADEYKVRISQDLYVWQKKESGPDVVTVKPGQDLRALSFRLLKTSAIGGRVSDENGQPLRTSVALLRVD